jgi:hypothetical protein
MPYFYLYQKMSDKGGPTEINSLLVYPADMIPPWFYMFIYQLGDDGGLSSETQCTP